MSIAFAAAGNQKASAGFQHRSRAAQDGLVVINPVHGGVGEDEVEWSALEFTLQRARGTS